MFERSRCEQIKYYSDYNTNGSIVSNSLGQSSGPRSIGLISSMRGQAQWSWYANDGCLKSKIQHNTWCGSSDGNQILDV